MGGGVPGCWGILALALGMLGRRVRGALPKTARAIVGLLGERISDKGASADIMIARHPAGVVEAAVQESALPEVEDSRFSLRARGTGWRKRCKVQSGSEQPSRYPAWPALAPAGTAVN